MIKVSQVWQSQQSDLWPLHWNVTSREPFSLSRCVTTEVKLWQRADLKLVCLILVCVERRTLEPRKRNHKAQGRVGSRLRSLEKKMAFILGGMMQHYRKTNLIAHRNNSGCEWFHIYPPRNCTTAPSKHTNAWKQSNGDNNTMSNIDNTPGWNWKKNRRHVLKHRWSQTVLSIVYSALDAILVALNYYGCAF